LQNVQVSVTSVFVEFLYRIAIGAAAVFALLLVVQMKIPKRTAARISRRSSK
jgi:hypothetical protein